jgi:hypothetical protein
VRVVSDDDGEDGGGGREYPLSAEVDFAGEGG